MATDDEAQKAISQLHEHQLEGRALVVNEARPKPEGGFGGGGGGRGRAITAVAVVVVEATTTAISVEDAARNRAGKRPHSSTTQPSRSWMIRLPYAALASECVT